MTSASFNWGSFGERIKDIDHDRRYMALFDLSAFLTKDGACLEDGKQKEMVEVVLGRLRDTHSDVQSQAVRVLGPLVKVTTREEYVEAASRAPQQRVPDGEERGSRHRLHRAQGHRGGNARVLPLRRARHDNPPGRGARELQRCRHQGRGHRHLGQRGEVVWPCREARPRAAAGAADFGVGHALRENATRSYGTRASRGPTSQIRRHAKESCGHCFQA